MSAVKIAGIAVKTATIKGLAHERLVGGGAFPRLLLSSGEGNNKRMIVRLASVVRAGMDFFCKESISPEQIHAVSPQTHILDIICKWTSFYLANL